MKRVWPQLSIFIFWFSIVLIITILPIFLTLNNQVIKWQYAFGKLPAPSSELESNQRLDYALQSLDLIKPVLFDDRHPESKTISTIYTSRELKHLTDVRSLLFKLKIILIFSLISAMLISISSRRLRWDLNLKKTFILAALFTLCGLLLFLFTLGFFWEYFFISFHEVLFPLDSWSFPSDSMLITLFPETFWLNYAYLYLFLTLTLCFLILLIHRFHLRFGVK